MKGPTLCCGKPVSDPQCMYVQLALYAIPAGLPLTCIPPLLRPTATQADFITQLRQFVVFSEEPEAMAGGGPTSTLHTQLTPGLGSMALRSPLLKPLSPPPADAEVAQLEEEVTQASLRVAELRTSMHAALQQQLAAKLASCRPTAELEPVGTPAAAAEQRAAEAAGEPAAAVEQQNDVTPAEQLSQQPTAGAEAAGGEQAAQPMEVEATAPALQLSPQPEELQQRLLAAANRMPALRARLEQATDRLQRVVAAVAADIARPPPNTVEKAVLGKTPGRSGIASAAAAAAVAAGEEENVPGVSPLLKQVRRHVACSACSPGLSPMLLGS